jgi:hypothetical protein
VGDRRRLCSPRTPPHGRYDEARGGRKHAYRGRYEATGSHIRYRSDTRFEADGEFIANVWRRLAKERGRLLRRRFELVPDDKPDLAEIMVQENGRCLSEAPGKINYGLGFIEWNGEESKRVYGDTIPSHAAGAWMLVVRICSQIVWQSQRS